MSGLSVFERVGQNQTGLCSTGAPDGGGEVDDDEVALGRGAVDADQRAEALAQGVEARGDEDSDGSDGDEGDKDDEDGAADGGGAMDDESAAGGAGPARGVQGRGDAAGREQHEGVDGARALAGGRDGERVLRVGAA